MRQLCALRHNFSFLPDIPPLSPLVKGVIGCPVRCVSVIGSYKTKRLYLIGSGAAVGSVLNESDKGVSCLNFEFDIFRFSLGERPLCPAKTNYSCGKDKNVKRLSPLLRPITHLLIHCFFLAGGGGGGSHCTRQARRTKTADKFCISELILFFLFAIFKLTPDPPPRCRRSIRGVSENKQTGQTREIP